ncbi:MAG: SBBP repeat-containing protein [Bryobacterales bacterium]|nr:SBBP repeat-containing protein [Bryobacterales bacterium]
MVRIAISILAVLIVTVVPLPAQQALATNRGGVAQALQKLPLSFEQRGSSEFVARGQGYTVDVLGRKAVVRTGSNIVTTLEFVNGRASTATPQHRLTGTVNYIVGNNPARWKLGLPTWERVTYRDLYRGVDIVYYGNGGQLEFDLDLKAGADLSSIRIRFDAAAEPEADADGALRIGDLRLMAPKVTQDDKVVLASYKLLGNREVGFALGAYDKDKAFKIDPTLVFSGRFGGGTSSSQANAIAVDKNGNTYIAGFTFAADFPNTNAAFGAYNANTDGFVAKVNANGTALVYSTYLGGAARDDLNGIAVDSTGSVWVVGQTMSTDFPLANPRQGTLSGGSDATVTKLSATGNLLYSTYLGSPLPDFARGVAVDATDNAYVAGFASAGFPTTPGAFQTASAGNGDAFVTKFNTTGSVLWSTFVGGSATDIAMGIAVDRFGNSYITGYTTSDSFPRAPAGGAQTVKSGSLDAFVTKLNFTGSSLLYFTFLGGTGIDYANAIAVDRVSGVAVIGGRTESTDFPTTGNVLQPVAPGGGDGFVAKLNSTGSVFSYSTYIGGQRFDEVTGVALDSVGSAYLVGSTLSRNFPMADSVQGIRPGNSTSVFRSADGGLNWTSFDNSLPGIASSLSPDPANASTIVAGTEAGIYRSTDAGQSWIRVFPATGAILSRSPANSAVIYGLANGQVVYQSVDNGASWALKGGLAVCCGVGIVADPVSAGTAYIWGTSPILIQKTTNGGANWHASSTGLPPTENIANLVASAGGVLYAALRTSADNSVFSSADYGATWVPASSGLPAPFSLGTIAASPTDATGVYITDFYTVYRRSGTNWVAMGGLPGSPACNPSSLAVSAANSAVIYFAPCLSAYNSAPVSRSTNSGASWTASNGMGVANVPYSAPVSIYPDPAGSPRVYSLAVVYRVAFAAKLSPTGQSLVYSSYLGEASVGSAIAADGLGSSWATGQASLAFPVTAGSLRQNREAVSDVFVTQISDASGPCTYSISPSSTMLVPWVNSTKFTITAQPGCYWTASFDQSWATITSGVSGVGSGVVYVRTNPYTSSSRSATLTAGGQTAKLTHLGAPCWYTIFSPLTKAVPASGGQISFDITTPCDWTLMTDNLDAVTIRSPTSGSGNATVTANIAPNMGRGARTLLIYSQSGAITITQAGALTPSVLATINSTPAGASVAISGAGCSPGTYNTPAQLTWTANTNCTIAFQSSRTVNGMPYRFYQASVNGGPPGSTNPLTVNSGSSAITINAIYLAPCDYSLSPTSQDFPAGGGPGSFTVNTGTTCTWSPVANAPWITLLPGGSSGTGKVNFAVSSNTGPARSGTISVAGQLFSIVQAALACTYTISPTRASFDNFGGNVTVSLTAPAGCPWTATSNASWITITSGSSGSGGAIVTLNVQANTGAERSGIATLAGQAFTVVQSASFCGALDVSSKVQVVRGFLRLLSSPFATRIYQQDVTVKNTSSTRIAGPVYVALLGLPTHYHSTIQDSGLLTPPKGTTLTKCVTPEGDHLVPFGTELVPGQSVSLTLTFVDGGYGLYYSSKVLSGNPSK